uniref:Uncharacterized protein n=1 Tax=Panstrongylus lignarius TaxID=156445 RepID=A0A224XSN5_9HEMI
MSGPMISILVYYLVILFYVHQSRYHCSTISNMKTLFHTLLINNYTHRNNFHNLVALSQVFFFLQCLSHYIKFLKLKQKSM